ncbi:undecaprenyl-diphosphatase [Tumebacillus sp. BK434]|uniref:undecaprenyl-diphosphate phosphatase n=1 Tax=Tumebacillus sp. BK434 TaxID=2512169 RepID=UPI0010475625|nr:undecaprenyl-diphosphate phosphatase [Tumebacillus sp. BK434]TCP58004.1 undecaprenyl-diphosphatase [Tumebacillus sp. BK434]
MDYISALIMGLVEGLAEFLPISSTGHLILTGELLGVTGEAVKTFEIFIQLGAILAATVLYWKRILGLFGIRVANAPVYKINLLHVLLGIVPALTAGFLLHGFIKEVLFSPETVLIGLVVGGVLMIVAEKFADRREIKAHTIDEITYLQALQIGLFQMLAVWPGFSRSGSTMSGGLFFGVHRKAAADFSFFIAIPMMVGATGYDLLKSWQYLSTDDIGYFAVGFITAFVVALFAMVGFLKLLERVKLTWFAIYRFVLAALFWLFLL